MIKVWGYSSILAMIVSIWCSSISYAQTIPSRSLPGITIVTRAQRGADETWRYTTKEALDRQARNQANYDDYLEELKETNPDKYLDLQRQQYEQQTADEYLDQMFGPKFAVSSVVRQDGQNWLSRPYTYAKRKSQIIIHHTANDYTLITGGTAGLYSFVRGVYRFHTFTRKRGDIGYHFLIGPGGEIIEGRAGGPGVTAAHTAWNNIPSIGIALIGNFELQDPTPAQLESLKRLSLAIAQYYGIDPQIKTQYHRRIDEYPYIQDTTNYSLVGHRDAGYTACPGKNLYAKLDEVREYVSKNLGSTAGFRPFGSGSSLNQTRVIRSLQVHTVPRGTRTTIREQLVLSGYANTCSTDSRVIRLQSCTYSGGILTVSLSKSGSVIASGPLRITLPTAGGNTVILEVTLDRAVDKPLILKARKDTYLKNNPTIKIATNTTRKIAYSYTIPELQQNLYKKVSVLLYELSTDFSRWNITCTATCVVKADSQSYTGVRDIVVARNSNQTMNIQLSGSRTMPMITLSGVSVLQLEGNIEGVIRFNNYARASFAKIPRNTFKGDITLKNDQIRLLGSTQNTSQLVVINTLPLRNYMRGIVESNDTEHIEKNKTMALLTKNYMLYYIDKKNPHPSIPATATYNAVDDARIFQKYVGEGLERTLKKRYTALDETWGSVILFRKRLPILPYFNCSAGFTRSAREKRGRTDTPYLRSVLDDTACPDGNFNGHGVGLAGRHAQTMAAQQNKKATEILQYFYPGTAIVKIEK